MKITLDSLGFDDTAKTLAAQLVEFKKLAAEYGCDCIGLHDAGTCYIATYEGTEENLRNFIDNCYGGVDELMDMCDAKKFEDLAD